MFHRFHTGTWQRRPSGRVPTRFIPVRVARATVTMAVLRICALLLLFDCQEAFHCCLVVACINRINMISIKCHRSGERCPGKREFDNRIEINRVRSGEIMWLFPLIVLSAPLVSFLSMRSQPHCCIHFFYSPRSGVDWVSRSAIRPAAGRTIEAVVLYAPQRDGQEKQLCYSPRSWASKSNITGKVI